MGKSLEPREVFLRVLKDKDVDSIAEFCVQHKSKKSEFTFDQLIKSFDETELLKVWESLFEIVQTVVPVLLEIDSPDNCEEGNISSSQAVDSLTATIVLANLTLSQKADVPLGLLQMTVFLHGIFLRLPDENDSLKNSISVLCEKVRAKDVEAVADVAVNNLLYLLNRTLRVRGTKADVKRVLALKGSVQTLLAEDPEDNCELMRLLKKCVASFLYLSCPEGCKFIEYLLCLDPVLVETFHEAIKLQLPNCSLEQSQVYGTIYYNSWMNAVKGDLPELKEKFELSCIQDFMYHAIHVNRLCARSLVPVLRKFMAVFHHKKKEVRVLRMLRDLYEPILWRALSDSNGNVRANASQLFIDVFPLEDPDFNIADTETELQRQMLVLKDLLTDVYPLIRSISAVGICLIMSCQWELFSSEMIKTYFKILIEDLACDSSSADVRCSVIRGVGSLLTGNPLAVPILKVFLPRFSGLFDDISDKVRIAFCELLLSVKKIRYIKYWDIVSVEHLLARLDEDKPTVGKLIVQLMCNSYLPEHMPEEFWLGRCIELLKTDQSASKSFFRHLPEFVSLKVIVKFMIMVCRTLNVYVKSKNKKLVKRKALGEDKENQFISEVSTCFKADGPLAFDNPDIIAGVMDAVTILWMGIQNKLQEPENKMLNKELIARFGMHMPNLLVHFKNSKNWSSVLMLCGVVPPDFIPTLGDICLSQLKNIQVKDDFKDYSVLLMCLCTHNKCDEVFDLIEKWILYGFNKDEPPPTKRRKVSKAEIIPKPALGVTFLQSLLEESLCRASVLKMYTHRLKKILEIMSTLQDYIKGVKKTLSDENEKMFLFRTFSALATGAVLLQGEKVFTDDAFIRNLLTWTSNVFFSVSGRKSTQNRKSGRRSSVIHDRTSDWVELGCLITDKLLKISTDVILMGFAVGNVSEYVEFAKTVVNTVNGPSLLASSVVMFNTVAFHCELLVGNKERLSSYQSLFNSAFSFVLQVVQKEEFFSKIPESNKPIIRLKLKEVMQFQTRNKFITKEDMNKLVEDIFNSICLTVQALVEKKVLSGSETDVAFPLMSSMLLALISSIEMMRPFLAKIMAWKESKSLIESLTAFIIATQVIKCNKGLHDKVRKEIKEVKRAFEEMFNSHDFDTASKDDKCVLTLAKRQVNLFAKVAPSEKA